MIFLQIFISGLLLGGIYVLLSIGLTLIFGVLKIVNFAHGEFLMMAMYLTYFLNKKISLDPYLSIFIVAPALFLIGLVIYLLIIKKILAAPEVAQIFATVGLSTALQNGALFSFSADYFSVRTFYSDAVVTLGEIRMSVPLLVGFLFAVLITIGLFLFLKFTYLGKAIRASTQDQFSSVLVGIPREKIYALTFALGIGTLGIAGAILMPLYPVFPSVGQHFVLIAFVVVVLGGMGNMVGALVGGLTIGFIEAFSGFIIAPSMQQLVYFIVFILILVLRPQGLVGFKSRRRGVFAK
ncbi:MAG: branched-chain amino acid ABC transporter permease [Desulfitobacteriaceae bacterium]